MVTLVATGCRKCKAMALALLAVKAQPGYLDADGFYDQYGPDAHERFHPFVDGEDWHGRHIRAIVAGEDGYVLCNHLSPMPPPNEDVKGYLCSCHPNEISYEIWRGKVELLEVR